MQRRVFQLCALALPIVVASADGSRAFPANAATERHDHAIVQDLMSRDLEGASGKEVRMMTVEYPPGGASPPHRHNAQVFVYVLTGTVRMQVSGSPLLTLGPGQTFYEGPDDVHAVSENASARHSAKMLVLMIRDKNPK